MPKPVVSTETSSQPLTRFTAQSRRDRLGELRRRVPSIGIDQQVDAGVLVLPDQVDGLGHRTDKAAQWSAGGQSLALCRQRDRIAGK